MEGNRLTVRLATLIFMAFSGASLAVEVLPQHTPMDAAQQAPRLEQHSTLQHLNTMLGQRPMNAAARIELTDTDRQRIEQDNAAATSGTPLKVGIVKPLEINVDLKPLDVAAMTDQTYSYLDGMVRRTDGRLAWAMRMDAIGTGGVRLRFDNVHLPKGALIYIYNDAGDVRGPYQGNRRSFWTHSIDGEQIYIQVEQADLASDDVSLRIGAVLLLDASSEAFCPRNAPCVEDGSCHDDSEWSEIDKVRKAVAHLNFIDGPWSYICSGGLLADTDATTSIPYFLTANHCIDTPEVAATLETWFNYQTAVCNGECPSRPYVSSTLGATLLHHSAVDDHSLLLLDEAPPEDAWYLGWTDTPVANTPGTMLYRLSYPLGSPQAYSTHRVDTTLSPEGFCGTASMPRGRYIFSRDVVGATEGGSSGSPVMRDTGQVVGQLFGVCGYNIYDVCDSTNNANVDGAFANYFGDIAKWLDPDPERLALTVGKFGSGEGRVLSSLEDDTTSPAASTQSTGIAKPTLLGGVEVEPTEWPWQAALKISTWRINGEWTCGGSVIDSKWILTAAHCVVDYIDDRYVTVAPSNIQVRTGSSRFEYGGQASTVKRIVKHPFYDPLTRDNDIALLELKGPVFVEPIRPVILEREEALACLGTMGAVTGWSATDACGNLATVLSKVDATLVNPSICRDSYDDKAITNNMICTRSTSNDSDLCQADDGSPLVVDNDRGGYVQTGIVSRGNSCEPPDLPTVHTRLPNYVDWIESMTGLDLRSDVGTNIIDCGSTCAADYPKGTLVTLTATASPGSTFDGWDGACDGTESTCEVTMTQALTVRATFNVPQSRALSCATAAP